MRILVVPLDWGLGHAARMLPVIRTLQQQGHTVGIGGGGKALTLLKEELGDCQCVATFSSLRIRYARSSGQLTALLLQTPRVVLQLLLRRRKIIRAVKEWKPDAIIADNHPGLWLRDIKTIYVTHQVAPKITLRESKLNVWAARIHRWIIHRHNVLLIADSPSGNAIAGELANPVRLKLPVYHAGLLSRFSPTVVKPPNGVPDIVVLLSGPEPQRTLLENLLIRQFKNDNRHIWFIRGMPQKEPLYAGTHIRFFAHLQGPALNKILLHTPLIISRSGYSTIMDLMRLRRSAVLIPTPGQPEQQYLGRYVHQKGWFVVRQQQGLDVGEALRTLQVQKKQPLPEENPQELQHILRQLFA